MDDERFLKACELREDGRLREAIDVFRTIAQNTEDPVDKAGVLLNVATTLKVLGEYDQAREQLEVARTLMVSSNDPHAVARRDHRVSQLEVSIEFDDADILSHEGKIEEALAKFDLLLKKHEQRLKEPEFRESYEMIQSRRGFILADLGRSKEALPILEEAESFEGRKAEIRFYLGHCYLADHDYSRAKEKFVEALKIGLYLRLEYRAHHELGIAYYGLKEYAQAKLEFEKGAEKADPEYIQQAKIWKWLENTSRTLGLKDEADRYSKLAIPS
jgi:tetratricopeptide (TPR) repeat protein